MSTPKWNDILPTPPPGGRLHEAWMTSFEQPDAGLLVEHLLPSLLGAHKDDRLPARHHSQQFDGDLLERDNISMA